MSLISGSADGESSDGASKECEPGAPSSFMTSSGCTGLRATGESKTMGACAETRPRLGCGIELPSPRTRRRPGASSLTRRFICQSVRLRNSRLSVSSTSTASRLVAKIVNSSAAANEPQPTNGDPRKIPSRLSTAAGAGKKRAAPPETRE
ncbi:hypothetical protein DIPPA_24130 [Diplonema papillatum]|nr:hypothetical protein DIPPA_24130 [Diplonema papillatum]